MDNNGCDVIFGSFTYWTEYWATLLEIRTYFIGPVDREINLRQRQNQRRHWPSRWT